jgi:hypothetical protein
MLPPCEAPAWTVLNATDGADSGAAVCRIMTQLRYNEDLMYKFFAASASAQDTMCPGEPENPNCAVSLVGAGGGGEGRVRNPLGGDANVAGTRHSASLCVCKGRGCKTCTAQGSHRTQLHTESVRTRRGTEGPAADTGVLRTCKNLQVRNQQVARCGCEHPASVCAWRGSEGPAPATVCTRGGSQEGVQQQSGQEAAAHSPTAWDELVRS